MGWSREKRVAFEKAFYVFLDNCWINSKDKGFISLGENLFDGQRRFLTDVFDGLEAGIHKFYVLKSRQLGITTIVRALSIFYIGVHKGLKGALVFDTATNREEARAELVTMIKDIPAKLKFPKIKGTGEGNREGVTLINNSKILFKNAGVKKSKSSGTLGRSVGLTVAHLSELCSYDNDEGLESFEQSLSDSHPDRLYIYESTARGFNRWWEMWNEARKDPHCKCIFLGWWSKDSQVIAKDDPDFLRYGETAPSEKELAKIKAVEEQYGVRVTDEQLAWVRRKMDPTAEAQGDADPEYEGSTTRVQEQPWTEQDAFQQTGAVFFAPEKLTDITIKYASPKYQTFMYSPGIEFVDMRVYKAHNAKSVELKVWDEPDPEGVYVLGIDPAYGENENNCRSAIQVLRCYADGVDQVAEYAWPLITTRQLAWVIASLLAWYGAGRAEARYILELNGPGGAVFNEMRSLKQQIENGYQPREVEERGLKDIFRNVKTYIYSRADSMGVGSNYHFKCLSVGEILPTPSGWTTMGALKVGDELFDEKGQLCRVKKCSPVMQKHNCYEIYFEDGSSIVADADHLWPTKKGLVKTVDLLKDDYSIGCTEPIQCAEKELPIDPYVLGLWLGDGHSKVAMYSGAKDDIEALSKIVSETGFKVGPVTKEKDRTVYYQRIFGLQTLLREQGLVNNKHVPEKYLRGSIKQRLALLQGLMDTDGSIDKFRQCGFNTTNPRLAEAFQELLRSLGIKPKFFVKQPYLFYKGKNVKCKPCWQFWFTAYESMPIFRIPRKLARQKNPVYAGGKGGKGGMRPNRSKRNKIVELRRVESVPVRCIEVDSLSRLYLAGRGMIPTHNTNTQLKVTILERLRDFVSNAMLHIRSMELIEEMKTIAREGDSIGAPGSMKDDRTIAMALAVHYWETKIKRDLMLQKRTREAEAARARLTITDQVYLFQQNQLSTFFNQKRQQRVNAARAQQRVAWRGR